MKAEALYNELLESFTYNAMMILLNKLFHYEIPSPNKHNTDSHDSNREFPVCRMLDVSPAAAFAYCFINLPNIFEISHKLWQFVDVSYIKLFSYGNPLQILAKITYEIYDPHCLRAPTYMMCSLKAAFSSPQTYRHETLNGY